MYHREANQQLVEAIVEMMFEVGRGTAMGLPERGARKFCLNNAKNYVMEAGLEMGWGRENEARKYYNAAVRNLVAGLE